MHTFCEETSRTRLIRPDVSLAPPDIGAATAAFVCPRLKRMTLSREWLQFGLFVQNTVRPPVVGSGGRSAWVWEDTRVVSPGGVRVSSLEAGFCLPVRGEGGSERASLVGAEPLLLSARPVESDERQAHRHEDEAQRCETGGLKNRKGHLDLLLFIACGRDGMYLDLGSWTHRLQVSGDDAEVEESRKDEDQTGSSGGTWDQRGCTVR